MQKQFEAFHGKRVTLTISTSNNGIERLKGVIKGEGMSFLTLEQDDGVSMAVRKSLIEAVRTYNKKKEEVAASEGKEDNLRRGA